MFQVIRIVIAIFGAVAFAVGLLIISAGGESAFAGIWPLIIGGGLLIAAVLERQRYRSEATERSRGPTGPGGGEPEPLPSQFQPTDERFVDPTTNRVMRVYVDPRTGERRYRAEGQESGRP
jgi:hypothetical protein